MVSATGAVTAVAATAATVLAGVALDSKYSIRSDIAQIRSARKLRKHWEHLYKIYGEDDWSFYQVLHKTYGQNEYDEAFLFEDRSWTYAQLRAEVGRLALAFERMGIRNRTVVAMMINNSPEFYFAWWALFKIGAIPAPINTAITQEPFRHCLRISDAEYLICSYELYDAVASSLGLEGTRASTGGIYSDPNVPHLKSISIYDYGAYPPCQPLAEGVSVISHEALTPVKPNMALWPRDGRPKLGPGDTSQYLFTSGTTGLPKAATWPTASGHGGESIDKYYSGVSGPAAASPQRWPHMFEKPRRLYACTPMFHGGATYALLPATVAAGGTVILARKFSVRNFWHDVRRTRANMMFYIGEMVRYLVQAPPDPIHPDETKIHGMEIIYGLGIAAPTWRAFRERFGVPWITEYYGATEGTTAISYSNFSNDKPVGKVAHWGPIMRSSWFGQDTFYIIRIDMESGEVIRDLRTGLCIQAAFGEVGESVNRIRPPVQRAHDYVGEGGPEATDKKLLRDVFAKGDMFWRLGDALSMDRDGYVTFHDRLGDTYRAKGHNISTAEVEMAFMEHPQISSANVYAINMKNYGYDGQMGCAAITMRGSVAPTGSDQAEKGAVEDLERYLTSKAGLASYAIPRFLRVLVDAEAGDTSHREQIGISDSVGSEYVSLMLKKLKTGLRNEAFSPSAGSRDRMYWIEQEGHGYVPLNSTSREQLKLGQARL